MSFLIAERPHVRSPLRSHGKSLAVLHAFGTSMPSLKEIDFES